MQNVTYTLKWGQVHMMRDIKTVTQIDIAKYIFLVSHVLCRLGIIKFNCL